MYIEEFLKTFNDAALDKLQYDCLIGNVTYENCSNCLLGHHQQGYAMVKYGFDTQAVIAAQVKSVDLKVNKLPNDAELEFRNLDVSMDAVDPWLSFLDVSRFWEMKNTANEKRRKNLLPLVDAEIERRKLVANAVPAPQIIPAEEREMAEVLR